MGRIAAPGLGVVCADFDGDGWPDILVANDAKPNCLWINQRDGTFKDEGLRRGIALNGMELPQGNMGIALGDVKGRGLFDVFISHLTEEPPALYLQGPRGFFHDGTMAAGLTRSDWRGTGFGVVLADFDRDGALDLAVVNGRVARKPSSSGSSRETFWDAYSERDQLFANRGDGSFRDVSADNSALCGTPHVSRGLACGDLDGDGAVDLLVTTIGDRARLYRNRAPAPGHWLLVRALAPKLRRDAYGATVIVRCGSRRWNGLIHAGGSYLCSSDPRIQFGLGVHDAVDELRVLWPDGVEEIFAGRPADRERRRAETTSRPSSWPDPYIEKLHRLRFGRQAGIDRINELMAQDHVAEAAAQAEELIRLYPQAGMAWLLLGEARLRQQQTQGAEVALHRAVELMPESVEAHFGLGSALFLQNEPAEAAACFRQAVQLKPASATAYYNLGLCLLKLEDADGARDAFQKAVNYRPQFAEAHRSLGEVLTRQGRPIQAAEHLRASLQINPDDALARKKFDELRRPKGKERNHETHETHEKNDKEKARSADE